MKKLILIAIILNSCVKSENKFTIILTNNKNHWVFYNYPDEQINKSIITFYTVFYSNGTFKTFFNKTGNNKQEEFLPIDHSSDNNYYWSFSNKDSLFTIGSDKSNDKYKVIDFNNDTIILKNTKNHIEKLIRIR